MCCNRFMQSILYCILCFGITVFNTVTVTLFGTCHCNLIWNTGSNTECIVDTIWNLPFWYDSMVWNKYKMSCLLFGDPCLFEVHLKSITMRQVRNITIGWSLSVQLFYDICYLCYNQCKKVKVKLSLCTPWRHTGGIAPLISNFSSVSYKY